ncbi:MAG: zinc ribbon domain-containing protein [Dehalococcoidia bacterium]|nr:zinc ribbon domain-containing protein [Dehalococcoidia bacterium]
MFCHKCGAEAKPSDKFCGKCGTGLATTAAAQPGPAAPQAAVGGREQVLLSVEQTLSQYPQLQVVRGQKSDLEIKNVFAEAKGLSGKTKVEFSAILSVNEAERKVVYWEMIKESSSGLGLFGGFKMETYKTDGKTVSGKVKESAIGPGGKIDYNWDYAQTRNLVKASVEAQGWKFTTSLMKNAAERK